MIVSIKNESLSTVDCLVEGNMFGRSTECINKQHSYLIFTSEKNPQLIAKNML